MVGWRVALLVLGGSFATLPAPCPAHAGPGMNVARPESVRVGSLTLHACGERGAYCGRLDRPLDPAGVLPDRISIYFEYYPHSGPHSGRRSAPSGALPFGETLVATEGGPGYPATESRDDYLALFGPLRPDHDVIIMDNRGTGRSGALDCRALQTAATWSIEAVAGCGESLGERASLYSTAYATDDLAAILDALGVRKIDLYGDSYGTYFEQVFASRHPAALRSVVLDGAYPLTGKDYAWYPSYAPAMRDKFNLACARSPACAALPGSSIDHIRPALEGLRGLPFSARANDIDGREREVTADAAQLASVMYGEAPALTTLREVDAASRAFTAGDAVPLLRLMAETAAAVDSRDPTGDPTHWSAGLAAAVMCHDPPQIFDMRLPPRERALDRDRALAERRLRDPDSYAPFTIDEYRDMPLDYSFLDLCVAWPSPPPGRPAAQIGIDASYPDIPALVISGELDNITTPADGAAVAAEFEHGVQVLIANSFHVNALPRARSTCAAQIVRRFLATTLPGDTACAARVPPVRLVARFATGFGELDAAVPLPGNQATTSELQMLSAAVLTAGDVLARAPALTWGHGVGLRGGTFRVIQRSSGTQVILDAVKWSGDLAVSGQVSRNAAHRVSADLRLVTIASTAGTATPTAAAAGASGRVSVRWPDDVVGAEARVAGRIGGHRVAARLPAP